MQKLFKKTTIYIARTDKNNNYKESGPCIDCLNVIKKLHLKRIVYSCDNNEIAICKPEEYLPVHQSLGRRHVNNLSKKNDKKK